MKELAAIEWRPSRGWSAPCGNQFIDSARQGRQLAACGSVWLLACQKFHFPRKKKPKWLCSTLRDVWVKTERMCVFCRRRRRRFSVRQQLVSHHPQFGRLLFHNHYLLPRWRQNAIRQPAVTVTPSKDRLLLSDSLNPRRRCQAALNAAPTARAAKNTVHIGRLQPKHNHCFLRKKTVTEGKTPAIRCSSVSVSSEAQKPCF